MTEQKQVQTIAGMTKEQYLAALADNGGRLKILSLSMPGEEVDVIVRPMRRAEFEKLQNQLLTARQRGDNISTLTNNAVRDCVLAPDTATFNAQLDSYPALGQAIGDKLMEMAGADAEVREKTFL